MNPSRLVDVFFYGLFMDANALRAKGLHPINERQAAVYGMTLRLGDRATLTPDSNGIVHGFVMALSHAELEKLYAEPSVASYRPEAVIARLASGNDIAALCYNLPTTPDAHQHNPVYAEKLRELGNRLGLPTSYLASIR
jgi:hypothetical protein